MRREKINVPFNKSKFERKADELIEETRLNRSEIGRAAMTLGMMELERLVMTCNEPEDFEDIINDNQGY